MNPVYIVIVVAVLILILIMKFISLYNRLTRASIKVDEAFSGIDVALAKRYDVLTKMIEVVKGYAKHEKEILFEIVNLRKGMDINEKSNANRIMNENFKKIDIAVENYPDLKANENFMYLQRSILEVEEHLQAARRVYNSNVSIYNQLIAAFPTNIVAKIRKMARKDFFIVDEEQKSNVNVDF